MKNLFKDQSFTLASFRKQSRRVGTGQCPVPTNNLPKISKFLEILGRAKLLNDNLAKELCSPPLTEARQSCALVLGQRAKIPAFV